MLDQLKIGNVYSYDSYFASVRERSIGTPKRKTIKETVPFSNVTYDFSAINGEVYYEERSLQYVFEITADSPEELETLKIAFASWVMGVMQEKLYDPFIKDYHFLATYDELSFADEEDVEKTTATVKFTAYPYKIANDTKEIVIPLYAYEEADAEILNNSSHRVTPTLNASVPVTVKVGENSYSIPSGEVRSEIAKFPQGKTNIVIQNKEKVYSAFSGEEIVVPNSSEAALRNLKAYGHSWQNTTEGKNLYSGEDVTVSAYAEYMIEPIPIGTYTISAKVESSYSAEYYGILLLNSSDAGFYTATLKDLGNGRYGWTLDSTQECVELGFYVANSDASLSGHTTTFSDIQIELGTEPTPYEPYTHGASPNPYFPQPIETANEVKVYGKNLLDESTITSVNVSGGFCYHLDEPLFLKGGQTYTAKMYGCSEYPQSFQVYRQSMDTEENVFAYSFDSDTLTFALEEDTYCVLRAWWRDDNNIPSLDSVRTQLELGEYATNYEPYTEQTLTLPYELNGADGVYDEIDFERKKFIQRWLRFRPNKTIVFSGETSDVANRYVAWLPDFMENYIPLKHGDSISFSNIAKWSNWATGEDGTFCMVQDAFWYKDTTKTLDEVNAIFADLGTDVEIVAQLLEPIETDLTDEEVALYQALRSNEPTTTILADGNVEVEVAVVPDEPVQVGTIKISFAEEVL